MHGAVPRRWVHHRERGMEGVNRADEPAGWPPSQDWFRGEQVPDAANILAEARKFGHKYGYIPIWWKERILEVTEDDPSFVGKDWPDGNLFFGYPFR